MSRAFFVFLLMAVALPARVKPAAQSPRIPLERLLPHYGLRMNAMSNVKDWPETAQKEAGVNWDFPVHLHRRERLGRRLVELVPEPRPARRSDPAHLLYHLLSGRPQEGL